MVPTDSALTAIVEDILAQPRRLREEWFAAPAPASTARGSDLTDAQEVAAATCAKRQEAFLRITKQLEEAKRLRDEAVLDALASGISVRRVGQWCSQSSGLVLSARTRMGIPNSQSVRAKVHAALKERGYWD